MNYIKISPHGSTTSSASVSGVYFPDQVGTIGVPLPTDQPRPKAKAIPKTSEVEKAVYAYIRALRALGKTTVNTVDIASALGIPIAEVNAALSSLRTKGVKTAA